MSNMVVRTNVFALNAHRNLTNVGLQQRQTAQRLSSGFRINSAADDAAGLAISEAMRAQIRGLDQASVNAQDGVGLIQTAEGALSTVSDMVIRIRELMVQAANDTNTYNNREMIQLEIDQIMAEINDITFRTQFNTRTLLDGGLSGGGGSTTPVSLQWMVFQQVRVIGLSQPGGSVGPGGMHPNPTSRNETSLRNSVIKLQTEFNALARRVADRLVAEGTISGTELNEIFDSPLYVFDGSTGKADLEGNMIPAETQQFRNIQNRLENLLRQGVRAAEEIHQITNDQIRALGGSQVLNNDGTTVFLEEVVNSWGDPAFGALSILDDVREAVFGPTGGSPYTEGLINDIRGAGFEDLRQLFVDIVGYRNMGASLPGQPGYVPGSPVVPANSVLADKEQILNLSMDVLADINLESNAMWFQIGPNSMQGMVLTLKGMHTGILGGGRGDLAMLIDVREKSGVPVSQQLEIIDIAEGIINSQRAQLGAVQNRLEFTRQSLDISSENLSAAESRIRDTDMAREMMRFTSAQVLQQAGISMLAQANQLPASILQLLQ